MIFTPGDFQQITILSTYLLSVSFSAFLPLLFFYKNHDRALKLTIPFSIALFTLIGYPFYCFHLLKYFPVVSLFFYLAVNFFFYFKLKKDDPNLLIFKLPKTSISVALIFIIALLALIFTRFHDSLNTVSPGHPDTIYHINYLKTLVGTNHLPMHFYPPGFHIIFYFPYKIIESQIYRFSGPILGVLLIFSIFLLFRKKFHKSSLLILILLSCLPIFNFLTWQTISYWPTTISYIFFIALIYLLIEPSLFILAVIALSLAITVPYLYIQVLPATFVISIIAWVFFRNFSYKYFISLSGIFAVILFGVLLAYGHVYLQTRILHPNGFFPEIPYAKEVNGKTVITSNYKSLNIERTPVPASNPLSKSNLIIKVEKSPSPSKLFFIRIKDFIYTQALPLYGTAREIMTVKGFRSPFDITSAKTYLWILASLAILPFSIYIKDRFLFIISTFGLIFGFISQTGILEIGTYRGRTSIYFLLLPILCLPYLFNYFKLYQYKIFTFPLTVLLFLLSFSSPPYFFRDYCPEILDFAYNLKKSNPNTAYSFITDNYLLPLISDKFYLHPVSLDSIKKNLGNSNTFFVHNLKKCNYAPEEYHRASITDINYVSYIQNKQEYLLSLDEQTSTILQSSYFSSYRTIFQSDNVIIYQNRPPLN